MAKSASQKRLGHKVRQGQLDPKMLRGSWNGVIPVTRKLPNKKKEAKYREDIS